MKGKNIVLFLFSITFSSLIVGQTKNPATTKVQNPNEKEIKKVKELIDQNLKKNINSNDFVSTIGKIQILSEELKKKFPEAPLGYYASSFYFERTNINVDSAFFQMKNANDKFNKLDEKNQQKLCDKFDLCKETFINNLDSLAVISLAYYCRNQRSDEVKKFLSKYPQGIKSYNIAIQIYEKLRFTEIFQSNDLGLYSNFFNEFPSSKYSDSLNAKIEQIEYDSLSRSINRVDYDKYLSKYPNSIFKVQILENIEILKQKEITSSFERCEDGLCLIEFLIKYPKSNFTNEAVEKIFLDVKVIFENGHEDVLKNLYKLEEIETLEFDKKILDSVIQDYKFKIVLKFENNFAAWDKYIEIFPNSPHLNEAIQHRDSLIYLKVLKHDSMEVYSKYIQLYPNSKYFGAAEMQIKKLQAIQENAYSSEKSFLKKYAIHEGKVLRLFVNEYIYFKGTNGSLPDNRKLHSKNATIETGSINSLWKKVERNNENQHAYYSGLKNDTLTQIKLLILSDYGVNIEKLSNATDEIDLGYALYPFDGMETLINNYITTAAFINSKDSTMYLTGFFVNKSHYKKDFDIFIAKIDLHQNDLSRKVLWLKTISTKDNNEANLDEWTNEIIRNKKSNSVIIKCLNTKNDTKLVNVDEHGNSLWENIVCTRDISDNKATIISLSNGNLIFVEHSIYKYGSISFKQINFQDGKVEKEFKQIGNEAQGTLADVLQMENGFLIVINYLAFKDNKGLSINSLGKSIENSCVNCFLPNSMFLMFSNQGELVNHKIIRSEEPRLISKCSLMNGNIYCEGQRGNDGYKYLDSYFLELDSKFNVISSNGME